MIALPELRSAGDQIGSARRRLESLHGPLLGPVRHASAQGLAQLDGLETTTRQVTNVLPAPPGEPRSQTCSW